MRSSAAAWAAPTSSPASDANGCRQPSAHQRRDRRHLPHAHPRRLAHGAWRRRRLPRPRQLARRGAGRFRQVQARGVVAFPVDYGDGDAEARALRTTPLHQRRAGGDASGHAKARRAYRGGAGAGGLFGGGDRGAGRPKARRRWQSKTWRASYGEEATGRAIHAHRAGDPRDRAVPRAGGHRTAQRQGADTATGSERERVRPLATGAGGDARGGGAGQLVRRPGEL